VGFTLDQAALGIGGHDEPLPGSAQLGDLEAQPVDRFPQRLDMPGLQGDRPPLHESREVVRHRTGGVK
jgi:hypothetical protein